MTRGAAMANFILAFVGRREAFRRAAREGG